MNSYRYVKCGLLTNEIYFPPKKIIYAFDFDNTLINNRYHRHYKIHNKLCDLYHSDANIGIIIITNQLWISTGKCTETEITNKINKFISNFNFPIKVYISTRDNYYRKPSSFIWNYFLKYDNSGIKVNNSKCIYVGDAAGRDGDFSDTDIKFAINAGINFINERAFFDTIYILNPNQHLRETYVFSKPELPNIEDNVQYLIILVGKPASGKSSFAYNSYLKYPNIIKIINLDTLKTQVKCLNETIKGIKNGQSVIIDNTNPDINTRKRYIDIVSKNNPNVRIGLTWERG